MVIAPYMYIYTTQEDKKSERACAPRLRLCSRRARACLSERVNVDADACPPLLKSSIAYPASTNLNSGHSLVYSWSWGDVFPSPCPAGWQGRDSPRRESNARAEAGSAHNRDTAISRRLVPADKWNKMRRTRLLGSAALPPHLLSSLLPLTCHLNDSDDRDASR